MARNKSSFVVSIEGTLGPAIYERGEVRLVSLREKKRQILSEVQTSRRLTEGTRAHLDMYNDPHQADAQC